MYNVYTRTHPDALRLVLGIMYYMDYIYLHRYSYGIPLEKAREYYCNKASYRYNRELKAFLVCCVECSFLEAYLRI